MTRAGMTVAVRYCFFAGLSMLTNLAVQAFVLAQLRSPLAVAMAAGTTAGFALKYWLDKRWIFANRSTGVAREVQQMSLYAAFSVATTALFWITEAAFAWLWRTPEATFAGAALGLGLGYVAKYFLDGRYTFGTLR